ncbi:MAG: RecQ family zinc-binding domain-containing protein, partial [Bacteroidota bacterium]|nr:RecQ family zinc-binding domain-containing protein [Bacteroidota bacterium]
LQLLQQEGFISMNDPVFTPSKLYFCCGKEELNQFEIENPELDPLIKSLLRTYAGIYDQPVAVHEKTLASLLNWDLEKIIKGLHHLHKFGIISYSPQKEVPQVYFNMPRKKSAEIRIDEKAYVFRKNQFIKRVRGILAYVKANGCRSVSIAEYFGEKGAANCGICDNCVKRARGKLSLPEFEFIYHKLKLGTQSQSLTARALFDQFADIHSEHLKKVIDFIQAENKLVIDSDGIVHIS